MKEYKMEDRLNTKFKVHFKYTSDPMAAWGSFIFLLERDGFIMTYRFRLYERLNVGCYWEVSIEDHHDELDMPEPLDDWIIYTSYHDPDQKDWYGNDYAASSAIEFETMKLFMEFVEVLESERFEAKNNPVAYIIRNTQKIKSKGIREDSNVHADDRGAVD